MVPFLQELTCSASCALASKFWNFYLWSKNKVFNPVSAWDLKKFRLDERIPNLISKYKSDNIWNIQFCQFSTVFFSSRTILRILGTWSVPSKQYPNRQGAGGERPIDPVAACGCWVGVWSEEGVRGGDAGAGPEREEGVSGTVSGLPGHLPPAPRSLTAQTVGTTSPHPLVSRRSPCLDPVSTASLPPSETPLSLHYPRPPEASTGQ